MSFSNEEVTNMNPNDKRTLLDHWLWEPPMLKAFVIVATIIPLFVCCVLLLTMGAKGFLVLVFLCFAPVFGLGYGFVGKKITRIRDAIPPEAGTAIPAKLVRGNVEAAGIVTMGEESLLFHPMVGKPSSICLSEISSLREVSCFNGSVLWGKRGFWFTIPDHSRLGCAIPNSYAERFRAWLSEGMKNGK